ncbi:MAG: hypothetical protein ACRDGD_08700 [Candidatus Limnocylindria bacterium]
MAATDRAPRRPTERDDPYGTFSAAVDLIRNGETVLTLIDPAARQRDPDRFSRWLSARLSIAALPRLMLPGCDARCSEQTHDPDDAVVLSDLALDATEPREAVRWAGWNDTLEREHQSGPMWYAGAPAMPVTRRDERLPAGTRLRRIATTDPFWVTYDAATQETLYRMVDGPRAGETLIAVTFGPAPLIPALAGVLIAPDHPPVRDRPVAVRLLAAGWQAVVQGLPYEE